MDEAVDCIKLSKRVGQSALRCGRINKTAKMRAADGGKIRNSSLRRQSNALIWMCDFPGGLFHPSDDKQEVAFRYAVEKINANRDILPKSRLSAQIEQIKPQDSFHASKRGESASTSFQSATKRSFRE